MDSKVFFFIDADSYCSYCADDSGSGETVDPSQETVNHEVASHYGEHFKERTNEEIPEVVFMVIAMNFSKD